jgi:hypothetical protein
MNVKSPSIARAAALIVVAGFFHSLVAIHCAQADKIGPLRRDAQGRIVVVPTPPSSSSDGQSEPKQAAPGIPPRLALPNAPHGADTGTNEAHPAALGSAKVTGIAVSHHDGQSFITWTDAAPGPDGQQYRYSLYRSDQPITESSLTSAQLIAWGIVNASGKLFGTDFTPAARLDPNQPTAITREGGTRLPQGSGLWVHTAKTREVAFYAVVVTDMNLARLSKVVPGENATTTGIQENPAPLEPIKLYDARERPEAAAGPPLTSLRGLPLSLKLHASESGGGGARPVGDYYLYFGNEQMGYRDGMPGVFSVEDVADGGMRRLDLFTRDAILRADGKGALETFWFGYYCSPQWAPKTPPRAYPFTEQRLLWLIDWTIKRYGVDRNRIYAGGYSMGGWGTATFALRHPEIFAAVYPAMPRMRQRGLSALAPRASDEAASMSDGRDYFDRMDMVKFVKEYRGELPFMAWSIARHDGFATWKEQLDMVKAMTATHRGFAFAWNNGNHGDGTAPMSTLTKYYPSAKFRRDQSYPAFAKSSIDADPGDGDPEHGDKEGGINLGFVWDAPSETEDSWTAKIGNDLASRDMTVDVTPRRAQHFHLPPGTVVRWQSSTGGLGTVTADENGIVTIPRVVIHSGQRTTITVTR